MDGWSFDERRKHTARRAASPLTVELMLDVMDKELERRGHNFVRYADDCNIYVRSQRGGERVMASIERFLTKRLKLKVNKAKSAVARPASANSWVLASRMGSSLGGASRPIAARFRSRVRETDARTRGKSSRRSSRSCPSTSSVARLLRFCGDPVGVA